MNFKNKKEFQTKKFQKEKQGSFKKGKFQKKRSLEQDDSSAEGNVAKKGKFIKGGTGSKSSLASPKKDFNKKSKKFSKQNNKKKQTKEDDDEEIPTLVPIEDDEEIPTLVPIEEEPVKPSKKALKNKFKNKELKEKEASKVEEVIIPAPVRNSDDPLPEKKVPWINKNRVLVFASRGINHSDRHLMQNLRSLMPHSKTESKKDKKDPIFVINEIAEMKNCQKCMYFERKRDRLYLWISNIQEGPSVQFLITNVHTMQDKRFTGNCLKGSRPLLSFDKIFDDKPEFNLIKHLFIQTFGVPRGHPKSQPFFDHIYGFKVLNNRIWFQNCQVTDFKTSELSEIGPRMTLQIVKILKGSFCGEVIYKNKDFKTITKERRLRREALEKNKQNGKIDYEIFNNNNNDDEADEETDDDMSEYEEDD